MELWSRQSSEASGTSRSTKYSQRPESAVTKGFVEAKKTVGKVDKSSEKADKSADEDKKG